LQISICKFSMNFAKISRLLSNLTKKGWYLDLENRATKYSWGAEKTFTTAPVLRVPNNEKSFELSTDTSKFATGTALSQKH